jgi:heat shock protein HtpX
MLRHVGAVVLTPSEAPELFALVERLAAIAGLPPPRVARAETPMPNAFVAGRRPARSIVVVTAGSESTLSREELAAVLAHELAHVANRDVVVMTLATVPRTLAAELLGREGSAYVLAFMIWPIAAVLWLLSSGLTLALSRYREYAADRGSALITGEPEQLMSALQKIADGVARIPAADLRSVRGLNAFFIVPTDLQRRGLELLSDHPPLEKRLARLGDLAREMGKPSR